jgi:hypothetical protein
MTINPDGVATDYSIKPTATAAASRGRAEFRTAIAQQLS